METDATHLMFVDADIGFEPRAVFRLYQSGYDLVAGAYPLKCEGPKFPVDYSTLVDVGNGFARTHMVTTGFMCIARRVFEDIEKARPDLRYKTYEGESRVAFFDTEIRDGEYLSEDYAFCRLWESVGGEVYLDTTANLTHQGQKLYTGQLWTNRSS